MSMCANKSEWDLTDFHIEKFVEACSCPAVWYDIYDRSLFEYLPGNAKYNSLDRFSIFVPALKIDEFSVVIVKLDNLLCNKIYPQYGESVTTRFLEEFLGQFYPEKQYDFVVKFSKNACIIDNVMNDGESSADFALAGRQLAFDHEDYNPSKTKKRRKIPPLKDYVE